MDRAQFENLFLHARLLPELALALMAQEIMAMPEDGRPSAVPMSSTPDGALSGATLSDAEAQAAPGLVVDWFGASGLSEDELRQLRESAERELAAFERVEAPADDVMIPPHSLAGIAEFDLGEPLDLGRELQLAYAARADIAPIVARAYDVADVAQLDAMLARVPGGTTSLTATMNADELSDWLARLNAEEPALTELLRTVARSGDAC